MTKALLTTLAGATLTYAALGACFDPELSSDISCTPEKRDCPEDFRCIDNTCVAPGDDPPPDADSGDAGDVDATPRDASSPPSDARPRVSCDPRLQEGCSESAPVCTLIVVDPEAAESEGYLGCVEEKGLKGVDEACAYEQAADGGYIDDCQPGLICSGDGVCREACDREDDLSSCLDNGRCETMQHVSTDLSPYGLCEIVTLDASPVLERERR